MATGRWRMSPGDQAYLRDVQSAFLGAPPAGAAGPPSPPRSRELADWTVGGAFSFPRLVPYLTPFDIRTAGEDFALPMVVIQGRDDHVVSFDAAKAWVGALHAPAKAFVPIAG